METVIGLKEVTKHFGDRVLFDGISLEVKRGEAVGIVGESGSGKTMLVKMLCGLVSPDGGSIQVEGRQIKDGRFAETAGVMLDDMEFPAPYGTGYENLRQVAEIGGRVNSRDISRIMHLVRIEPASRTILERYTPAMKQRLKVAMVLMEDPQTVLLDGPVCGMAEDRASEIRRLLSSRIKEAGITMLLTDREQESIEGICTRLYRISDRKLLKIF